MHSSMTGHPSRRRTPAAVATVLLLANLAAGCALRGPYVAPDTAPATVAADADTFALQPYDPAWWREFDDPILLQLEEAALAANHDVAAAVARLDQARAFFSEIKRDRYPRVTVGASVDRREHVTQRRGGVHGQRPILATAGGDGQEREQQEQAEPHRAIIVNPGLLHGRCLGAGDRSGSPTGIRAPRG